MAKFADCSEIKTKHVNTLCGQNMLNMDVILFGETAFFFKKWEKLTYITEFVTVS